MAERNRNDRQLESEDAGVWNQALGTTSAARTTILTNTGSGVINISGIGITGTHAGDFVLSSDCGTSVSGGASCRIDVTFSHGNGKQERDCQHQ